MKEFSESKEFKNTLSKQARDHIREEAIFSLSFYQKEFDKIVKNPTLSEKTKEALKSQDMKQINMFKNIIEAMK